MNMRAMTAAAFVAAAPFAANASLVDFTDPGVAIVGDSITVGFGGGNTVTATGTPDALTLTAAVPGDPDCTGLPLACANDGIGVKDDETTFPSQFLTLAFKSATQVSAFHVLDLFFSEMGTESVKVWAGTDSTGTFLGEFFALTDLADGTGYARFEIDFFGTALTFGPGKGKDDASADFALAAIEVVPLPASALLLLGGLGGIAALKRRKKA